MGKSVNKVTLLGNVGRDPESKTTQGGMLIVEVSIATTERRKVNNEYQEFAEWHRITFFGKLAEIARDYVRKGAKLYVEGHLKTESWDENGTTRYRTKIIGEELVLLSSNQAGHSAARSAEQPGNSYATQPIADDDIPF